MKPKTYFAIIGMMLIINITTAAAMESANYSIKTNVMSGGGSPMTSASFRGNQTLGQAVISAPVSSVGYDLYAGFWYTLPKSNCIWDIYNDDDGDVDGLDIHHFLNPFDESDLESFSTEFGRTDCSN